MIYVTAVESAQTILQHTKRKRKWTREEIRRTVFAEEKKKRLSSCLFQGQTVESGPCRGPSGPCRPCKPLKLLRGPAHWASVENFTSKYTRTLSLSPSLSLHTHTHNSHSHSCIFRFSRSRMWLSFLYGQSPVFFILLAKQCYRSKYCKYCIFASYLDTLSPLWFTSSLHWVFFLSFLLVYVQWSMLLRGSAFSMWRLII